jgi:hypothetical protein
MFLSEIICVLLYSVTVYYAMWRNKNKLKLKLNLI